jgi:hypothetical protein
MGIRTPNYFNNLLNLLRRKETFISITCSVLLILAYTAHTSQRKPLPAPPIRLNTITQGSIVTLRGATVLDSKSLLDRDKDDNPGGVIYDTNGNEVKLGYLSNGIPKIIHQSWKSGELPVKFWEWSGGCRAKHPDWYWVCYVRLSLPHPNPYP